MSRKKVRAHAFGRQTAEYLGGTRFRVTWKCGHSAVRDVNAGKPKHLRMSPQAAKLFGRYWTKDGGGTYWGAPCPRGCAKEER